ncbi:hypothetical protein XENTR_v10024884 [Xenopus tropicalis]|uniref:HSPB (heat shock 27kDa)-associated protein 1 n=2 Tax=Xenopus tropicalis TaxID=8364 RepID=A0A803JBG1_XENTR|nr:HSPB1-associated protein 1 [Xenopus tropicalis]KAE8581662.1 hypothetical protein XENTR_v10024884 [Xenopus tropicalis]
MEPAQEGRRGHLPKPFTPQQARDLILNLTQPVVFHHMVSDWPASAWNVGYLSSVLSENPLCFRIGKKALDTEPQFETRCSYISGTLGQFQEWVRGTSAHLWGSFSAYDPSEYWAYADYKYLAVVFKDRAEMLQDVVWADFGFPGRDGKESSLWVGSSGANTPCHVDSYGCNLVLQVQGRKTWHLYPPGDTPHMYPTRIPYEESSIFSKVNVVNPDRSRFPLFSRTSPHVVTLHPGQVLLVPRHWWHYVQSVDDMTVSINSWIELDSDHESRVQEAVTRTLVCLFKSADPCSPPDWLNPTEDEVPTHQTNLRDLSRAVGAYTEYQREKQWSRDSRTGNSGPKRRRTEGEVEAAGDKPLPSAPFGPHLSPVAPTPPEPNVGRAEYCSADAQQNVTIETLPKACDSHARQLGSDRTISSEEVLDCLVDPQVIRLVTELLLQRLSP